MKKIEAIIRPEKLEDVRKALELAGSSGVMISEIEGHGKQKGKIQQWRGEKYRVELLPKIKIDIVVEDVHLERIIKAILESARTGEIGDGKIFVSEVSDVLRIRTGERGPSAL